MKKMNRKGFTLVELLATIVVLGIIASVTIVSVTDFYKSSQDKAEESFKKQLIGYVEDYIALYGTKLEYDEIPSDYKKCYKENSNEVCDNTTLYKTSEMYIIGDIIDEFANKDVHNPKTDIKCTNDNTILKIYRDSDYVYCFTISPENESCIDIDETISTCENMYKEATSENYVSFK